VEDSWADNTKRRTFFIDPLDGEWLLTVKLADISHLGTQTLIADVRAEICDQHVTKSQKSQKITSLFCDDVSIYYT